MDEILRDEEFYKAIKFDKCPKCGSKIESLRGIYGYYKSCTAHECDFTMNYRKYKEIQRNYYSLIEDLK